MAAVTTRAATGSDLATWARALGKVAFAGAVTGVMIGGVGGRLAMLVLRLTSNDLLRGASTDDGFTIGVVTTETLFLLGVTTGLGVLAALTYAAARSWYPRRWREWIAAGFFGLVGGADLVSTGGLDFRLLEPLGLAIAMFVAIPAVAGFLLAWWIERWLATDRVPGTTIGRLWPLVAFVALGPVGIAMLLLLVAGWAVAQRLPQLGRAWRSEAVTWVGRSLTALGASIGAAELVRDAIEILGR
jgi:hypothetical protein